MQLPSNMKSRAVTALSGAATVGRRQRSLPSTNILDHVSIRGRLRGLTLAMALCVLGFGVAVKISRADGEGAPAAPPADSKTSQQTIAITPPVQSEKPIVLPQFTVNGLRERMIERQGTLDKHGWGTLLCLERGAFIDNVVFLCNYRLQHPHELIRLILWQASVDKYKSRETGALYKSDRDSLTDGVGPIVNSHHVQNIAVYTSGKELHVRAPERGGDHGEGIYPYFSASELRHLSDKALIRATGEVFVNIFTVNPDSVPGDDANLQVYYAQERLKQIGTTAIVVPATFNTSPTNDKMLIFSIYHVFYVWRPYYGTFRLKKEALAQFGIPPAEIALAHQDNTLITSDQDKAVLCPETTKSSVANPAH